MGNSKNLRSRKNAIISLLVMTVATLLYQNFILPESPSRNVDTKTVQLIEGKYTPTTNFLPSTEFTQDGRLALAWRPGNKGPILLLNRPENVIDHLYSKKNPVMGANLVKNNSFDAMIDVETAHTTFKNVIGKGMQLGGRMLLCEKTEEVQNPTLCSRGMDCYNLVIIVRYAMELPNGLTRYKMVSNEVLVRIGEPKTPNAYVADVLVNEKSFKIGPAYDLPILAEPTIAGDRRLLVTRLNNAEVTLSDLKTKKRNINLVYSVYDRKDPQCDVTQWRHFHPISHAHYDTKNRMRDRYKFARFPIRDSLGKVVPNGEEFGGSYPWIDRNAANLFFTTIGDNPFYNFDRKQSTVITPFAERPGSSQLNAGYFTLDDVRTIEDYRIKRNLLEVVGNLGGFSVAGFWTHGKVVLLDGLINNADFLFRISDRVVNDDYIVDIAEGHHRVDVKRDLKLYKGNSYETVGSVREKGNEVIDYMRMLTPNSTFLSSLENRLNYNKNVFPATPRDVVWHFGTSRHTEELAFDDYNSPFILINAEMTAALETSEPKNMSRSMRHLVGYFGGVAEPQITGFPRAIGKGYPALLQNSGTAPDSFMTLPYYGKINMQYSRIEPIAKGGIFGKGLWLEDRGSLHFQIPSQTKNASFEIAKNKHWYVGAFIDGRGNYAVEDKVDFLTLGKTSVRLKKARPGSHLFDRIIFSKNGKEIGRIIFPGGLVLWDGVWGHIGISFEPNKAPEVFFNGYSLGRAHLVGAAKESDLYGLLSLTVGDNIYLGDNPESPLFGPKGWFDEFKVVARVPTYEEACNYARGTLVALSLSGGDRELAQTAGRYPSSTHEAIAQSIYEENPQRKFACHTRYFYSNRRQKVLYAEDHAHLKNLPEGSRSIREDVLGTKNMLVYGRPRPDFTQNRFCLSCHTSSHPFAEMNLTALRKFPALKMEGDRRRQPMQPDRFMRGHIPAGYFGEVGPVNSLAVVKVDVDKFIHPDRAFVDLKWTHLGPKYKYSIDVLDTSSGKTRSIKACVSANILGNKSGHRLYAECPGANNYKFPITHEVKVRVCYTNNGRWDHGNSKCSRYVPLNLHNDGELEFFIKR